MCGAECHETLDWAVAKCSHKITRINNIRRHNTVVGCELRKLIGKLSHVDTGDPGSDGEMKRAVYTGMAVISSKENADESYSQIKYTY